MTGLIIFGFIIRKWRSGIAAIKPIIILKLFKMIKYKKHRHLFPDKMEENDIYKQE